MNIDKESFIAYKPYSLSWSVLRKIVAVYLGKGIPRRVERVEKAGQTL